MIVHLQVAPVQKLMNSLALAMVFKVICVLLEHISRQSTREELFSYKYFLPFEFASSSHPLSKINNTKKALRAPTAVLA